MYYSYYSQKNVKKNSTYMKIKLWRLTMSCRPAGIDIYVRGVHFKPRAACHRCHPRFSKKTRGPWR